MHLDYMLGNEDTGYSGLVRSYIDEPVDEISDWSQTELLMYLNMEHRHLFSIIRGLNENYFGRTSVFDLTASLYKYWLPDDCINPKRLEVIQSSAVTGSSPNYVVDEEQANPQQVEEILLSQRSDVRNLSGITRLRFGSGYFLFDDRIEFEPNLDIDSTIKGRLYYLPSAPDLHRGLAQVPAGGQTSTNIRFADNAVATTIGRVIPIDNYYQNMLVEIVYGTGVGQKKRITSFDGTTLVATIDSAWGTNPSTDTQYSIVSPVKEDFQELLALGAVLRAKGIKVEDDVTSVGQIYTALRQNMIESLEKRNHQFNRRVVGTQRSDIWF